MLANNTNHLLTKLIQSNNNILTEILVHALTNICYGRNHKVKCLHDFCTSNVYWRLLAGSWPFPLLLWRSHQENVPLVSGNMQIQNAVQLIKVEVLFPGT